MSKPAAPPAQTAGSSTYTPFLLKLYDLVVLTISNSYAWHCSTTAVQLPLFRSSLGRRHLDVGVGTGYYPANALKASSSSAAAANGNGNGNNKTPCREIVLLDLNPNTLDLAAARIAAATATTRRRPGSQQRKEGEEDGDDDQGGVKIRSVVADVTDSATLLPLLPPGDEKFDSVSVFYLLHCLAGPPESKNRVFDLLKEYVADGGVLVGTTILGEERPMNWLARRLMTIYNAKGIFDNWKDSRAVFEEGLRRNFEEVDVQIIGRTMVFTARRPIKASSS
ncbi:S-adenosyl-L-methionine dependent methyltransferase [Trichoderma citrinoviride]|uniref:S-adenosyl-L-methionine dependent methyltransferase n=1 Tax=Trichoderma citrinoviride TaxID=58853 RepID=A0A2T4AZ45_9HYPO|nr:S-adenosyl-L-methionine dependent methyltransferase [Trichoderma citrinoviride]PTB62349.1 S-adenosyl-L-methionine dependent methyltransferase [Trichoderma citrinoviride]